MVEGARQHFGQDGRVLFGVPRALAQHLDVTAKRDGADGPFGTVRASADMTEQHLAKADREPQHFHAAQARDTVVAQFMNDDQYRDRKNKR